jgi:hypothetical protein
MPCDDVICAKNATGAMPGALDFGLSRGETCAQAKAPREAADFVSKL